MKKRIIPALLATLVAGVFLPVQAEDLRSAFEYAKKQDPTFLNAATNVKIVAENIDQAQSFLLPQVGLNSSFDRTNGDIHNEQFRASIGLDQTLFRWDYWKQLSISEKQADQAIINYSFALQELIYRLSIAYFDVLSAKDTVVFSQAELSAVERQLEQTKQRFEVGLTAITDVHEAQARYDEANAALIRAKLEVDNAYERLTEITGERHTNLAVLNTQRFSTTKPAPENPSEWQTIAEQQSLEIASSRMNVDIAEESIGVAQSGYMPRIGLTANYSVFDNNDRHNNPLLNSVGSIETNNVGIQFSLPLYSGGGTNSLVRQARQQYVLASQNLDLTHRRVIRNTRVSYNTVLAAISGIVALEQAVVSAKSALRATEAGFEVGTRTIVDVLNSTQDLFRAERNLAISRYDYILAVIGLKGSAGLLTENDLIEINSGLMPDTRTIN